MDRGGGVSKKLLSMNIPVHLKGVNLAIKIELFQT